MDMMLRLEPATAEALAGRPAWDSSSVEAARASLPAVAVHHTSTVHDPRVEREDTLVEHDDGPPVPVRWYRTTTATASAQPCIVWLHGGGFVMGSLDSNDARLEWIAVETGCTILSVDWRLAPEHPYPAGLDDATAVWRWLHENLESADVDANRIILAGASAGGGLAAALCLRLRDLGLPQPHLQMLIYPMLDDRETPSMAAITHPALWNREMNRLGWAAYLRDVAEHPTEPPATAVPARALDLSGLPPTFICVGDVDGFLDEDVEYATRLIRAGVPTELHVYPGVTHGAFTADPRTPRTRQFVDDALRAVRMSL